MESVKRQTSFRLDENLLKGLKAKAKKEHQSLNSYVEGILLDVVYDTPNAETIAAIEEAKAGKYAGTLDLSSMEAFIKSCE
jgi:hypothetical protein